MARIVITNEPDDASAIKAHWHSSGLDRTIDIGSSETRVCIAKKRVVKNENSIQFDNGDWICGVGTYITKDGKYGAEALKLIRTHFDSQVPSSFRRLLFGHYVISLKLGDEVIVLTDELGTLDLFYNAKNSTKLLITNTLSDYFFTGNFKVNDYAKLLGAFHSPSGLYKDTILPGVKRLGGNECIQFSCSSPEETFRVVDVGRDLPTERTPCDINNAVRQFSRLSHEVFSAISHFESIGINATGGLDSRLIIASARGECIEPLLLYGVGNSAMTNTKQGDLEAAKVVSEHYGWPLYLMDWRQSKMYDAEERRRVNSKYGFKQLYGSTSSLLREIGGKISPYPQLQLGGYNPAFTNEKPWLLEDREYTLSELTDYLIKGHLNGLRGEASRAGYRRFISAQVEQVVADLGFNGDAGSLDKDQFVQIYLELRKNPESANLNAFNEFGYYLAPYFTADLYGFLVRLPSDWRKGDKFQILSIFYADNSALNIPIFSGLKKFRLLRENMTMNVMASEHKQGFAGRIKRLVKAALPKALINSIRGLMFEPSLNAEFRLGALNVLKLSYPSRCIDYGQLSFKYLPAFYRLLIVNELCDSRTRRGLN